LVAHPGNVLFTLFVIAGLLWAQSVGALPIGRVGNSPQSSSITIAYQGRLADADGHPLNSDDPGNPWLYASFFVDGVHPVNKQAPWGGEDYLGSYHVYEDNTNGGWMPWSFTQLAMVGPGSHTVEAKVKVNDGTWFINGSAIQVVVMPK